MKYNFSAQGLEKTLRNRKIIKGISLEMESGKVYGIIGPNSAGKTTLTKLLSGNMRPDAGEIYLDGKALQGKNARCFIQNGIRVIYNDRVSLYNMRVDEYLLLSQATGNPFLTPMKKRRVIQQARELLEHYDLEVNMKEPMKNYSLGMQKLLELFMAMICEPKVLIMDELDPWLRGHARELFYKIIQDLCKQGCIILIISHELPTIQRACQVISLIKEGAIVNTQPAESVTAKKMVEDFFMAEKRPTPKYRQRKGEELLRVEHLSGLGIEDISFSIREGDVIGLSGNRGAARSSLAKTLMGAEKYNGDIYLWDKKVKFDNPETALRNGVAYITSDIFTEAIFPGLSILQNMLPRFMQHQGSKKQQNEIVEHYLNLLNIKDSEPDLRVDYLSNGSQKKVVIARWLLSKSEVFIFERLSQNLDSLAVMDIFSIIRELQRMGKAVILISDHTRELIALSNVIHVFNDKTIVKSLYDDDITKEKLLFYLTGNREKNDETLA